jgi:hypothetical protein
MLKISTVKNPQFAVSFSKIMTAPLGGKTMFSLRKLSKAIESGVNIFEETRKAICADAANKDAEGKAIIADGKYDIPEQAMAGVTNLIAEAGESPIEFGNKIPFSELENANLTTIDLIVLESIIEEPKE